MTTVHAEHRDRCAKADNAAGSQVTTRYGPGVIGDRNVQVRTCSLVTPNDAL
ncbi:MAG: hypothetical protein R2706_08525 [Acidimicrobiales bacterium]